MRRLLRWIFRIKPKPLKQADRYILCTDLQARRWYWSRYNAWTEIADHAMTFTRKSDCMLKQQQLTAYFGSEYVVTLVTLPS